MKLKKDLRVNDFTKPKVGDSPFVLELEGDSKLTFDKKTLKEYGISPSRDLKGKILTVTLSSREMKKGEGVCLTDLTEDDVILNIEKKETQKRMGLSFKPTLKGPCFNIFDKVSYSAYFETFHSGGGVYTLPIPFYELNLEVDEKEYNQLRELPSNTVMKLNCKVAD